MKSSLGRRQTLPLLLLLHLLHPRASLGLVLSNRVTNPDGSANDRFAPVSFSFPLLLVGAYFEDVSGKRDQGAAYLFDCSSLSCTLEERLEAPEGAADDSMGDSVSLSGTLALIGVPYRDKESTDQGSALLYDCSSLSSCSLLAELVADDGGSGDRLGETVALEGSLVVLGAPYHDVGANANQGAVYVFSCSGALCVQEDKLVAPDGEGGDFFGDQVAISGSRVLVNAFGDDIGTNSNQGSAYLFDCSSFPCNYVDKLTSQDGAASDVFGESIAIDGDLVVIGAYQDDVGSEVNQGSAYLFVCSGSSCVQREKLTADDGDASDNFGGAVSISGTLVVVGARYDENAGNVFGQGAAYLFDCSSSSCVQVDKLTSGGSTEEFFGASVDLDGLFLAVGANGYNSAQGAVYVEG